MAWFSFCTARTVASGPSADKIEVFIDDKPVMVEPGSTVLQVGNDQELN